MEYHSCRRHPAGIRAKREHPSSEKKREANRRRKKRKLQRLLLENFDEGDVYITLTYDSRDEAKGIPECGEDMEKLRRWLRKEYRKAGKELRWICTIEKTKRGVPHAHMVFNTLPGRNMEKEAAEWWKNRFGKVNHRARLYLDGAFESLAEYLAKADRNDDGELMSKTSRSRNLRDPEPETREYSRRNVWKAGTWIEPKPPKGYVLVKESLCEMFDEATGLPYRFYTLLKT